MPPTAQEGFCCAGPEDGPWALFLSPVTEPAVARNESRGARARDVAVRAMEVRRPGMHGRAGSLSPRWCGAATAAALAHRALLCSLRLGAQPGISLCQAPLESGCNGGNDECAPGAALGAAEPPVGHCTPPASCRQSPFGPCRIRPPQEHPGIVPFLRREDASHLASSSTSVLHPLCSSSRSPPVVPSSLPTWHAGTIPLASWPNGQHWASSAAEAQPQASALEMQPVFSTGGTPLRLGHTLVAPCAALPGSGQGSGAVTILLGQLLLLQKKRKKDSSCGPVPFLAAWGAHSSRVRRP